jgi:hypothetical protein
MQFYNAKSAKKRRAREGISMLAASFPSPPPLPEGECRGVGINEVMASVVSSQMPFSLGEKERANRCCIFNAQSAKITKLLSFNNLCVLCASLHPLRYKHPNQT